MAELLDISIGDDETHTISEENADQENTAEISALGSGELIVDGVTVTITSIANIDGGSSPTFTTTNGGDLTLDMGLLDVSQLNSFTFNVNGASHTTLDGSTLSALSEPLNSYTVNYADASEGSFTFNQPDVGALDSISFDVNNIQAGDELNIGSGDWSLDGATADDAYDGSSLHITQGNGVTTTQVNASIEMTQAEFEEFKANQDTYLSGSTYTHNCFAAGTMIATPDGEVPVETLSIGDLVMTASGEAVPVKWIGRQSVHRLFSAGYAPVRIKEGALADGQPNRDLVLTANHGVIIDGLVINAGALVNHDTIDYLPWGEMPEAITYYHIETETHEVVIANGTEAETYIDYVDRQAFDNYDEYVALYGLEQRIVEMPRHRISSRRLIPSYLRQRLGIQDMTREPRVA
ncbi:Hint domain-containing protein [Halomonas caseinilytica]|uniref:Hint domain-containing protein n=1 Tax=Halomonas caseinilytica TaxID=438744 RepID=UPI0009F689C2|nr:Hint domain-containing protein [Halomonas caseinilytica]